MKTVKVIKNKDSLRHVTAKGSLKRHDHLLYCGVFLDGILKKTSGKSQGDLIKVGLQFIEE